MTSIGFWKSNTWHFIASAVPSFAHTPSGLIPMAGIRNAGFRKQVFVQGFTFLNAKALFEQKSPEFFIRGFKRQKDCSKCGNEETKLNRFFFSNTIMQPDFLAYLNNTPECQPT